ncbi:MAG: AAA family ATPase [Promicromonosporaceae bacterium]|nr:AAA family ATPase [Promicromonosporaceae bacterium]
MPGGKAELAREQAVVDRLYARLDALRDRARSRLADVRQEGPSGSPQNRSERDAFATLYEDRAAQLDAVEERLAFGRLDLTAGEARYVGRIGLNDDEQHALLTDWRAPAAEPFYRATALDTQGVRRRRHLVTSGRKVTGVEDELLDLTGQDDLDESSLSGEGALLAALATRRTGRMGDIVSTIQSEQDRIIRSDLTGALVVQGGPGTGKTAVALHRAAYLLYAHRRLLERSGVLLVGPSRSFLRYIDQVLPSLGETGVVSTTLGEIIPGTSAVAVEASAAAEIKGRAVWANIVSRAVQARERVPDDNVHLSLDGHRLVIYRDDVRDAIARARRTHKPHNQARTTFVRDMLGRLASQYEVASGGTLAPEDRAIVLEDLRMMQAVRVALNLAWFPISPKKLIDDLLSRPHRLAEAAPMLTEAERNLVLREPWAPWTESDIPLLDEAAELLGYDDAAERSEARARASERAEALEHARSVLASGAASSMIPIDAETLAERFASSGNYLTTAERAASDRSWTYGHVVVDEAQELSSMAWRTLLRRVPTRSMTIVGDVAQTSAAGGARSWPTALNPVLRGSWRLAELTVSYRTPALVADTAQRMARAAGLPVSPLTAAREVAGAIAYVPVSGDGLLAAAAAAAARLASEFIGAEGAGRVAVIVAQASAETLAGWQAGVDAALAEALPAKEAQRLATQRADERQVALLTPREVKGLEFDAVVLVEPADIATGPGGYSDLYVSMTRPTQRLVVVHATPLPPGFIETPREIGNPG